MSIFFGLDPALFWAIVGVILIFMDLFIPSFVIAFFGGGALVTAITTYLGITPGYASQLLVFIISSIALLVTLRRALKRLLVGDTSKEDDQQFDVEIGKVIPVIEEINPEKGTGRVRYQGTDWGASAVSIIPEGESVKIVGRENLTLKVTRLN